MCLSHPLIVVLLFPLKSQLESIDKSQSVCITFNTYDNIIVMDGFNNNVNKDGGIDNELDVFCDTFNLTNLVKLKHVTLITINQKLICF